MVPRPATSPKNVATNRQSEGETWLEIVTIF